VRQREAEVLTQHQFVVGFERWRMQEAGDPGYIIVSEQMRSILVQETGGNEDFELLAAVELQNATDAVQDVAADATLTRFEPAERAAVDLGQVRNLLLGQAALVSEPRQHAS
jgi:hypothetical protein